VSELGFFLTAVRSYMQRRVPADESIPLGHLEWPPSPPPPNHEDPMNPSSASDSPLPASTDAFVSGSGGTGRAGLSSSADEHVGSAHAAVHRMAQAAHEAVDQLEKTLGAGSDRVMDWQHAYGERARDQVRANPLAAVGIAFGVGVLLSRLFVR